MTGIWSVKIILLYVQLNPQQSTIFIVEEGGNGNNEIITSCLSRALECIERAGARSGVQTGQEV